MVLTHQERALRATRARVSKAAERRHKRYIAEIEATPAIHGTTLEAMASVLRDCGYLVTGPDTPPSLFPDPPLP